MLEVIQGDIGEWSVIRRRSASYAATSQLSVISDKKKQGGIVMEISEGDITKVEVDSPDL